MNPEETPTIMTVGDLLELLSLLARGNNILQNINRSPLLFILCKLSPSQDPFYDMEINNIIERLKESHLFSNFNPVTISLEEIRKGAESNEDAFNTFVALINDNLKNGVDVIIDDTNCLLEERKRILTSVSEACYRLCILINEPIEGCLEKNKDNDEIISRINENYNNFEVPFLEEGYDYIYLSEYRNELESGKYYTNNYIKCINYKDNGETLQKRQNDLKNLLKEKTRDEALIESTSYYNIGKLISESNYENIGAYDFISNAGIYDYNDSDTKINVIKTLDCAFYINYQNALNKNQLSLIQIGEEKYNNLILLNKTIEEMKSYEISKETSYY